MTSVFVLLVSGQVNVDDFTERFKEGRNLRLRGCRKRASEATNKDSVILFPLDWLHVSICSESIRESRAIILTKQVKINWTYFLYLLTIAFRFFSAYEA